MKQKKKTPMLLLPCAVIVAMIGITAYFACSADDDWEDSPEYLHTHAPMLTRAGVDVSGGEDGDTTYVLIFKSDFSVCSATASVFGNDGTATFTLSSTNGRRVNNSIFSVNVVLPSSCLGPGYTTYTLINSSYQDHTTPTVSGTLPSSANATLNVTVSANYRRERFINNSLHVDTINNSISFTTDVTEYTEILKYYK